MPDTDLNQQKQFRISMTKIVSPEKKEPEIVISPKQRATAEFSPKHNAISAEFDQDDDKMEPLNKLSKNTIHCVKLTEEPLTLLVA